MNDIRVISVRFLNDAYLEHGGLRLEEKNFDPQRIRQIGDTVVYPQQGNFYVYLAIPPTDDFVRDLSRNGLEWRGTAEVALRSHFDSLQNSTTRLIRDGDALRELTE
jgi:hypothetical protein